MTISDYGTFNTRLIAQCEKFDKKFGGLRSFGAWPNGGHMWFAVRNDRTHCGLFGGCSSPNSVKIQSRSHKSRGGQGAA